MASSESYDSDSSDDVPLCEWKKKWLQQMHTCGSPPCPTVDLPLASAATSTTLSSKVQPLASMAIPLTAASTSPTTAHSRNQPMPLTTTLPLTTTSTTTRAALPSEDQPVASTAELPWTPTPTSPRAALPSDDQATQSTAVSLTPDLPLQESLSRETDMEELSQESVCLLNNLLMPCPEDSRVMLQEILNNQQCIISMLRRLTGPVSPASEICINEQHPRANKENPTTLPRECYSNLVARAKGKPQRFIKLLMDEMFCAKDMVFSSFTGDGQLSLKNGTIVKLKALDSHKMNIIQRAVAAEFPLFSKEDFARSVGEKIRKTRFKYRKDHSL